MNTSADAAATLLTKTIAVGTVITGSTLQDLYVVGTKTGSPGTLIITGTLSYRLVG